MSKDKYQRKQTRPATLSASPLKFEFPMGTQTPVIRPGPQDSRWPWCPGSSVAEIVAHYQAENEPAGADRALQRTADL